ncbi:hypothetical protein [Lactiplantibacillus mudanjiangensis]|uniref:Uncharacterized protein n=1 Tax=Lactiplantibacillus mudanjiangensis TaxID=1296538 RepID=A0A660E0A9_9LACO|nr:hypothetical protein [Lactiplantibacillus mudanjiangensis]VDG23701.1 hypothetical protein [Lactobacillus plantarum] [Lactiplantibacillus mudanjiangensis]VDG27845.1 hypothetical protein [Lactobacillus plantarum] [Lactiplantibacillus mudanjiangensis]
MSVQVVPLKRLKTYKAKKPLKWLKGKELAEEWNISPAQVTKLAQRDHDPLPSDMALGPRRYEWKRVLAWRERQNVLKQKEG